MNRIVFFILIYFNCTTIFSQSENIDTISCRRYDPFTNFVSHLNHIRNKKEIGKTTSWEIQIRNGQIADTLKFNLPDDNNSGLISFVHCKGGIRNEKITIDSIFNCSVLAIDTIEVVWNNNRSIITKFKGNSKNGTILTFFYSDSLGIIKFYSNNKSLCFENYSKEKDLLNACLKEIYLNSEFHTRYDNQPRTIGFLTTDYELVLGKRKKSKKKKLDEQFRMYGLKTPCEVGYIGSCY